MRPCGRAWRAIRQEALTRARWRCQTCGRAARLEIDHIVPLQQGGHATALHNLQALCRRCHITKTRRENHTDQKLLTERLEFGSYIDHLRNKQ